jgi:hypothetical protein
VSVVKEVIDPTAIAATVRTVLIGSPTKLLRQLPQPINFLGEVICL